MLLFKSCITFLRNHSARIKHRLICLPSRYISNSDLFHEITFTSESCACVVSMQALEGFALASHILIVLSTEHDANTCQVKIDICYEL